MIVWTSAESFFYRLFMYSRELQHFPTQGIDCCWLGYGGYTTPWRQPSNLLQKANPLWLWAHRFQHGCKRLLIPHAGTEEYGFVLFAFSTAGSKRPDGLWGRWRGHGHGLSLELKPPFQLVAPQVIDCRSFPCTIPLMWRRAQPRQTFCTYSCVIYSPKLRSTGGSKYNRRPEMGEAGAILMALFCKAEIC